LTNVVLRLVLLLAIDGFLIWFALNAFAEGFLPLGIIVVVIGALVNYTILAKDMYPIRWMLLGLILMAMFAIWPIILTIFVAFTNYGDGHLLSKAQSIQLLENERYLPEGGAAFSWTGYRNDAGEYALWLQNAAGESFFAFPGEPLIPAAEAEGIGELDENGIPTSIEGYNRLNALQVASDQTISQIQFGSEEDGVQIRSAREAAQLQSRYQYNEDQDVVVDLQTEREYAPVEGIWTAENGAELPFGFQAQIGFNNFTRFFGRTVCVG
jgi:ABC-type sugar transport system permease subunit